MVSSPFRPRVLRYNFAVVGALFLSGGVAQRQSRGLISPVSEVQFLPPPPTKTAVRSSGSPASRTVTRRRGTRERSDRGVLLVLSATKAPLANVLEKGRATGGRSGRRAHG